MNVPLSNRDTSVKLVNDQQVLIDRIGFRIGAVVYLELANSQNLNLLIFRPNF